MGEASLTMDVKAFAVQNDGCREFPGDPVWGKVLCELGSVVLGRGWPLQLLGSRFWWNNNYNIQEH